MAKKKTRPTASSDEAKFKIGAVSRITQIPVDTLRAWERRYQVVSPQRTGSAARLYSDMDVERLKLIKRLVSDGHAISSVAGLSLEELEQRARMHNETQVAQGSSDDRLVASAACFSDSRNTLLPSDHTVHNDVEIFTHGRSWTEFETKVLEALPDALVVEAAALLNDRAQQITRLRKRSGALRVIVIYAFAPDQVLADFARDGIITLRSPFDVNQLVRELTRPLASRSRAVVEIPDQAVPRLFDSASLEALAAISPAVQCECPHHLVDIVRTLTQFETYSLECENRDDEDAALHAKLRMTTSAARELFERALIEVAEHEGITLPAGLRK